MGTFLTEGAGVCVFGLVGFVFGLDALRQLAKSRGYRFSDGWRALGVLVWGFGTFVFVVMQSATFYTVPIVCAFACLMDSFSAIGRSVSARSSIYATGWLALASLAWGLAVGSRPNYLLSLPALAIPLFYCISRLGDLVRTRKILGFLAGAIAPAALVGAGLAWYNFSRFGSILEFGIHYQFAASDQRFVKLWSAANALSTIRAYLLNDGLYLLHFPFFVQTSATIGVLPWMPFTVLGVVFPALLISQKVRHCAEWWCIGSCALVAGTIHLLGLCMLPFSNDRYLVDFAPSWTLLALGVAMALLHEGSLLRHSTRRMVSIAVCALAFFGIIRAWMLALDKTWDLSAKRKISVISETIVARAERLFGVRYGPLLFRADFHGMPIGSPQALVETGGGVDGLFAERIDPTHLRLSFVHLGNPPIAGRPFAFLDGASRTIKVNLGSFYPPKTHPFFAGWDKSMIEAVSRVIRVEVDGTVVLQGNSSFYGSDARHVAIGRDVGLGLANFAGSISDLSVETLQDGNQLRELGWKGAVRLKIKFPPFGVAHSEPLISSGTAGASDMVYVTFLSPTTLRFGEDSSSGGAVESLIVEYDPSIDHTLDISYDALYGGDVAPVAGVVMKFDGSWKLRALRPTHSTKPYAVSFGYNAYNLGTASESFSGIMEPLPISPDVFVRASLPSFGRINIGLQFLPAPANTSEPLLSSGISGRGDMVFVRYGDNEHVSIGIDHWGVGSVIGKPFKIDYDHEYHIQVTSAAFLPQAGSPLWGTVPRAEQERQLSDIKVTVNGALVVEGPWNAYPSNVDEIVAGINAAGFSSCGPSFSGKIVNFDRDAINASK